MTVLKIMLWILICVPFAVIARTLVRQLMKKYTAKKNNRD